MHLSQLHLLSSTGLLYNPAPLPGASVVGAGFPVPQRGTRAKGAGFANASPSGALAVRSGI